MKNQLLQKCLMIAFFISLGVNHLSAQIADFDTKYCYQIIINNKAYALGIPEGVTTEEACIAQQAISAENTAQLWKIESLDTANHVYHIVNLASDKALGESSWIVAPAEGAGQSTPTSPTGAFDWNGKHHGVVQLTKDTASKKQQWIIKSISDTIYNIQANWDADSLKHWNFWSAEGGVGEGNKNIAIFPNSVAEGDRIGVGNNFYAYYFIKTATVNPDAPTGVKQIAAKDRIKIYPGNGFVKISGEIDGKLMEVYNIQGQILHKSIATSSVVNIQLSKGIYFVKAGSVIKKIAL